MFHPAQRIALLIIVASLVFDFVMPCYGQGTERGELMVPKPRFNGDLSHDYHIQLLKLALAAGADGRPVPSINAEFEMEEGRATIELRKGSLIDVFWMGTDAEKERTLKAIKIPTTRGLIGFRKFIIRQQDKVVFDRIETLTDLRRFVVCQGANWPDTTILRSQGFEVATTATVDSLYAMLDARRCDFFPRGYHDYRQELASRSSQYPDLMSYDRILLYYPFAVYFFTNKDDIQLSQWIEKGLNVLVDNGKMMELLLSHPLTRDSLPIKKQSDLIYLPLSNPTLPVDTEFDDRTFWFTAEDFGLSLPPKPEYLE